MVGSVESNKHVIEGVLDRLIELFVCLRELLIMSSSPVMKVVVKAANGSMGDFRVDASHQWRIQDLKKHLYRHYPTHPVS